MTYRDQCKCPCHMTLGKILGMIHYRRSCCIERPATDADDMDPAERVTREAITELTIAYQRAMQPHIDNLARIEAHKPSRPMMVSHDVLTDGGHIRPPAQAGAASVEPFGYWIEQKHADPVLLRKPAYIPEPSELRKVTPLYATPAASGEIPGGVGGDNNPCRNCGTEYPRPMRTAANTPPDELARIQLLADVELHLQSVRIFLTKREKMHPCGVDLHDELQARVTAALSTPKASAETGEVALFRQALEDVCDPIGYLKRMAEAEGARLGGMAYTIANDIATVQRIARTALSAAPSAPATNKDQTK